MASNPWTKKNPFMSMWLSAANQAMGAAKGQVTAAAWQQASAAQTDAMRQLMDFWAGKPARQLATPRRKARR